MVVWSRGHEIQGETTGTVTLCQMEGCGGTRVWVRWPDGKLTRPCDDALKTNADGSLEII
jgi:hypothetical protein